MAGRVFLNGVNTDQLLSQGDVRSVGFGGLSLAYMTRKVNELAVFGTDRCFVLPGEAR
jgi:hypothetical protein